MFISNASAYHLFSSITMIPQILFLTLCLLVSSALISFANSLDPDQAQLSARQKVGPDLDPNCLAEGIPEGFFRKKMISKKNQQTTKTS